jgi:hypothetical protein
MVLGYFLVFIVAYVLRAIQIRRKSGEGIVRSSTTQEVDAFPKWGYLLISGAIIGALV